MDSANASAEALRKQIQATETKLFSLKAQLAQVEAVPVPTQKIENLSVVDGGLVTQNGERKWPLLPEEYKRYGRQMIVPSVGIQGIPLPCVHNHFDLELCPDSQHGGASADSNQDN